MIQGTTPTYLFKFSVPIDLLIEWRICFAQEGKENLVKTTQDCVVDENQVIYLKLTQEETFAFDTKKYVNLRAKALTKDNNTIASKPKYLTVDEMLDKVLFEVENTSPTIIDTSTIDFEFDTEPCGFGLDFEDLYIEKVGTGGGGNITVDSQLSLVSENPVQNKVVTQALNSIEKHSQSIAEDLSKHKSQYETRVENVEKIQGSLILSFEELQKEIQNGKVIKSIEQTTTSTEDNGINVITVTFTDGTTKQFQIRNGSKGSQGEKGQDGKDYVLTEEDKQEIVDEVVSQVGTSGGTTQKEWKKIFTYEVVEGEEPPYLISKDGDGRTGNPFEITDFQGTIVYNNGGSVTSVIFGIDIRTGTNVNNRTLARTTITNFGTGKKTWKFRYVYFGENQGGLFLAPNAFMGGNGAYPNINVDANKVFYIPARMPDDTSYYYNSFSAISISPTYDGKPIPLADGDTIEIWGVRK